MLPNVDSSDVSIYGDNEAEHTGNEDNQAPEGAGFSHGVLEAAQLRQVCLYLLYMKTPLKQRQALSNRR